MLAPAALVLTLAALPGAQSPPDNLAAQLAAARTAVDQGKPRDAITSLSLLDRSDPRVAELLGVAY
jgi:hypothetical protein